MNIVKLYLEKLKYYRDLRLLWHIFIISLRVTFAKYPILLSLANPGLYPNIAEDKRNAEKIYGYVGLCLYCRRKPGIHDSCLTRSILICRLFRESGFNAKINFGTKKADKPMQDGWSTIGHSWVTLNGEEIPTDYPFIFKYP